VLWGVVVVRVVGKPGALSEEEVLEEEDAGVDGEPVLQIREGQLWMSKGGMKVEWRTERRMRSVSSQDEKWLAPTMARMT
jgi:hypothetical protein